MSLDLISQYSKFKKKNTKYELTVLDFFECNNLICDIQSIKQFLTSSGMDDNTKISIIESIADIKQILRKNRKHDGTKVDLAVVYKTFKYKKVIKKDEFIALFYSLDYIRLKPKQNKLEITNALAELKRLDISNEEKANCLIELINGIKQNNGDIFDELSEKYANNVSELKLYKEVIFNVFKDIRKNIDENISELIELLTLSIEQSDYMLEQSLVKKAIVNSLNNNTFKKILMVDPKISLIDDIINRYEGIRLNVIFNNLNIGKIFNYTHASFKNINTIILDESEKNSFHNKEKYDFIIIFGNHFEKDNKQKIIYSIINHLDNNTELLILDANSNLENKNRYLYEFIMQCNLHIKEITLLPADIKDESLPANKCLISLSSNSDDDIKTRVYQYNLFEINDIQYLNKYNKVIEESCKTILDSSCTLRSRFRELKREDERKTLNTNSTTTFTYFYSDYIKVHATISKNNKVRARLINILDDRNDKKMPVIDESLKMRNSGIESIEDAKKWVEEQYLFGNNSNGVPIHDIVYKNFFEALKQVKLDIRTLLYYYYSFYNKLKNDYGDSLVNFILSLDIAKKPLDYIKANTIIDEIDNKLEHNNSSIDYMADCILILDEICDFAIRNGHAVFNQLTEYVESSKNTKSIYRDLMLALRNRSLVKNKYKELVNRTEKKIKKGKMEWLFVLFKELSPIYYDQIPAIRIKDVHFIETFDQEKIAAIYVCNRIEEENGVFVRKPLRKDEEYRLVVLQNKLSKLVAELYSNIEREHGNEEDFLERPLLEGNRKLANSRYKVFSPKEISKMCKKAVAELKLEKVMIKLFDGKIININSYKGDFLASNLRYYLTSEDVCFFNRSEIEYYFGNKGATTHSRNYIDYENDGMLLMFYERLQYLNVLFGNEEKHSNILEKNNNVIKVKNRATYKNQTIVVMNVEKNTSIEINNKFGFSLLVSKMEEL